MSCSSCSLRELNDFRNESRYAHWDAITIYKIPRLIRFAYSEEFDLYRLLRLPDY